MNVIITGGTGLIGKQLTKLLVQNGHHVIILSRNAIQYSEQMRNADVLNWDSRSTAGWGHLVENSQVIVNLAGENIAGSGLLPIRWSRKRKNILRESRLLAGEAILQAVRQAKNKPSVVIQASGIGYYGDTKDRIVNEDSSPGDDFMALLAVEWEASTQPVEAMGVRRVVIRTAANLCAGEGALLRMMLPFRFYAGGPLGSGKQYLPWIHPEDEAAAIFFLIENRRAQGAFNLASPQAVTNAQFGKILAKIMARPYWFPAPGFALKLALGEVASMVLSGQRAEPKRLLETGFVFKYPDLESALTAALADPLKKPK